MEELRSTDILDKEIQDDARKKAEKILQDAENQCKQILLDVDSRIEKAKIVQEEYYEQKINQHKKDLDSVVPLEKSRFLVDFINDSVTEEINNYLKSLSEEQRINLVLSMLNNFNNLTNDKIFDATIYGFNVELVKKEISKVQNLKINSYKTTDFVKTGQTSIKNIDIHQGIILVASDGCVKLRLTLEELIFELIDKYREELAVTLFGGRLPE